MSIEPLTDLTAGMAILAGGDQVIRVTPELADAFAPGDRLAVVGETVLHIPAAEGATAAAAVGAASDAFARMGAVTDEQITAFFEAFARRLEDTESFAPIAAANQADIEAAKARGRSTTRLVLSDTMRADMVSGLRSWATAESGRGAVIDAVEHDGWSVELRRAGLGVVGFVFEGRPNVFADACGVIRSGNTVVFRIGSDALGTARAIVEHALDPALAEAGLPAGAASLVDSAAHAAGWAMFSDPRLGLAVARGSGPAVTQLGTVARQAGVPVSLHGTGGAWIVADSAADGTTLAAAVLHSLDRKVCNTLNVCCVVRSREHDLVPAFHAAAGAAAAIRGVEPIVHTLAPDDALLAHEWEWDKVPEVSLMVVDDVAQAVEQCNLHSPRFVASLVSNDSIEQDAFYRSVEAPFVGDGFTRWVDGQFALDQPELGLSNWQGGRLFGRGAILSGDSAFTVRLRAHVEDHGLHR